jgi:hypothetical protein
MLDDQQALMRIRGHGAERSSVPLRWCGRWRLVELAEQLDERWQVVGRGVTDGGSLR